MNIIKPTINFLVAIHVPLYILIVVLFNQPDLNYYFAVMIALILTRLLVESGYIFSRFDYILVSIFTLIGVYEYYSYFFASGMLREYLLIIYAVLSVLVEKYIRDSYKIRGSSIKFFKFKFHYDIYLAISILMLWGITTDPSLSGYVTFSIPALLLVYYSLLNIVLFLSLYLLDLKLLKLKQVRMAVWLPAGVTCVATFIIFILWMIFNLDM